MKVTINIDDRIVNTTRRLFRKNNILLMCGLIAFGSAVVYAAPVTLPNQFTPNTVISSSQVNANFTAITDGLNPLLENINAVSGNIGIGTTTPAAKLDVAGTIKGTLLPDYDSGWVSEQATTTHTTTLTHGLGAMPSRYQIWLSDKNDGTFARSGNRATHSQNGSPENVWVSNTTIGISFFAGDVLIFCDLAANTCPDGRTTSIESGYMRVLAWR